MCRIFEWQSLDVRGRGVFLIGQCEVSFMTETAAIQTNAHLVANLHVIHRLVAEVCEIQLDGDGTRRRDRNCTRESVQHGQTSASHAIQQLHLGP